MHCDTPNGGAKSRDVSWARFSIVGKFHVSHAEFLRDLSLKSFQLVSSFTKTFCWSLEFRFLWTPSSVEVEIFVYRWASLSTNPKTFPCMAIRGYFPTREGLEGIASSHWFVNPRIFHLQNLSTHDSCHKKNGSGSTRLTFWFCLALRVFFFSSWRIFQRGLRQSDKLDGQIMDFPPCPVPMHLAGFSKVIGWEKWHPKRSFRKTRTNKNPYVTGSERWLHVQT